MKLWPSSLFGRLALLLVGVLAIAVVTTILLFRQDRAALMLRHFGDTRIVQLRGLRDALDGLATDNRREVLARLGRRNGVRILAAEDREPSGFSGSGWRAGTGMPRGGGLEPGVPRGPGMPGGPMMRDDESPGDPRSGPLAAFVGTLAQLEGRFSEALGPGIELRVQPRARVLWVRLPATGGVYWVGFPLPPRPGAEGEPTRALVISVALALGLLVAAFVFARYLARPLRDLEGAVARVGRGETPQPLPESGPSEIAAVNRGFNTMLANLTQTERDRALLLAGVSHDLRTPLARLRLGVELAQADAATRAGMVADIEEMDRIIGQFLDFARDSQGVATEIADLDALVRSVVQRYANSGRDVRFTAGSVAPFQLRPTAIARLMGNLIDNALAYGAPPVDVGTMSRGTDAIVEVADRGPGIAPGDVERLKQPFTRSSDSRARADGAPGAGLGLAIVDRIARLHGGRFDLLPREGGGTIARITLPMAPSAATQTL